jgi:hypothetical protein
MTVIRADVGIPNCLRVDDDHGPVATLVEAAGFVNADLLLQAQLGYFLSQSAEHFLATLEGASLAGGADEYVLFEYFHLIRNQNRSAAVVAAVVAAGAGLRRFPAPFGTLPIASPLDHGSSELRLCQPISSRALR